MLRTSIILSSVALALLAFIVFFERGSLTTTEREGRRGRVLENFVRDRVTRIEVQRRGVTTVLVQDPPDPKDPLDMGGWRVEQPFQGRADRTEVDTLISALEWVEARRTLGEASADELKNFGLTAPRYRVRFQAGREWSGFSVGLTAANGGGVYLQPLGKSAVYVVGNDLLEALNHEPSDYHSKELHEGLSVHTFERLVLTTPLAHELRIQRKDEFDWLESPFVALVSMPELTSLVDALDALKATRYVAATPSPEHGLETPRMTAVLDSLIYERKALEDDEKKDKKKRSLERLEFRVGAACAGHAGESYLRVNQGPVYCASDDALNKLQKPAESLRETRVLPLEDVHIRGAQLHAGNRELTIEVGDKETTYHLRDGSVDRRGTVDPAALAEWYTALRGTKVESFAALDPDALAKLKSADNVASFKRGKDDPPYTIRIAHTETAWIGSRLSEPSLLVLPAAAAELLAPTVARFRKKRVLEEPELEFSQLRLTRANGSVELVAKVQDKYELREPQLVAADRASIDELVRLISKLEAQRFIADRAQPEHGFATPHLTLRIDYGKRTHTLKLAAESGDQGRYATLDEDPAVFIVPSAIVRKLDEPLRAAK